MNVLEPGVIIMIILLGHLHDREGDASIGGVVGNSFFLFSHNHQGGVVDLSHVDYSI